MASDGELTRRRAVGLAAGATLGLAAGGPWVFAQRAGEVVKVAASGEGEWSPVLLDRDQGAALARLVEALIPRTESPGAREARVHEYIDLAVSLGPVDERKAFVDGLRWLERRCRKLYRASLRKVGEESLVALLRSISDQHAEHAEALRPGAAFFVTLKRLTIFGYYTSLEGRVQELGLPDTVTMQKWQGCRHDPGGDHTS